MAAHIFPVGMYGTGRVQMDGNIMAPIGSDNIAAGMMSENCQNKSGNHPAAVDMGNHTEIKLPVTRVRFRSKSESAAFTFMYVSGNKSRMF